MLTKFTKEDIQKHYDFVAKSLDNELVAYRSKRNGLLRIIDVETGYCLLADAGCPLTKNMNQALNIANKYFLNYRSILLSCLICCKKIRHERITIVEASCLDSKDQKRLAFFQNRI